MTVKRNKNKREAKKKLKHKMIATRQQCIVGETNWNYHKINLVI